MLIRLVRHACAGHRAQWTGDDAQRPLDLVGREQALAVAELLGRRPAGRLLSSPTRRCLDTLVPLAAQWAVPVLGTDVLAADADVADVFDLLGQRSFDGDVLCTHGEVMEAMLPRLGQTSTDALLAKGTIWELTVDDGEVTGFRHVVPGGFRRCAEHVDGAVRT